MDLRKPHPKFDFFADWTVFCSMLVLIGLGAGVIGAMFGLEFAVNTASKQIEGMGDPQELLDMINLMKIFGLIMVGVSSYGLTLVIPKLKMKIPN